MRALSIACRFRASCCWRSRPSRRPIRRSRSTSWCPMRRAASPTSPSRIVGAKLTEAWGQQVVVENKPGGNGFIAMGAGAKAPADGYTLTMATVGDVAINPALFKDMPYKWERFRADQHDQRRADGAGRPTPTRPTRASPTCSRRRRPSPAAFRSARPATAASTRSSSNGWRSTPAPSSSTFPTRAARRRRRRWPAATFRSRVLASSSVAPQVKAGRLRVLAVTGAQPSKFNPEWPTLQSQGVKEVDASNWTLLLAPKGTPKEIVDKLQAEVVKILAMPDVKERFAGGGVETIPSTGAELDAKVKKTAQQLVVIVDKAKIKPD